MRVPQPRAIFLTCAILAAAGCPKPEGQDDTKKSAHNPPPDVQIAPPKSGGAQPAKVVDTKDFSTGFRTAVVLDPPQDQVCPPDKTFAGKSVAQVFLKIAHKLWDDVRFTDEQGRKLKHVAVVKTDAGEIRIELYPESAPNHVRNFIALARAGYYDGLPFHRSLREEVDGKIHGYLETGCPKGTGGFGYGSVGYWLRPEIDEKLSHENGSVGFWQSRHPETQRPLNDAACKFYIALGQPVGLDGNFTIFGKIIQGLDAAHTINSKPVLEEDAQAGNKELAIIRQVTILESLAPSQVASGQE